MAIPDPKTDLLKDLISLEIKPEDPKLKKKNGNDAKEVHTHTDKNGKKTHMTRRKRKDGTEFLNFGFGIQKGVRKKVPMRINGAIGQPTLGPRPGKDGGAVAAYTRQDKEKGQIVEIVDPLTGNKIQLGQGKADSPALLRDGDKVDAFYRENGKLKRATLSENLTATPSKKWPTSELAVGPILSAKKSPDGTPNLITRDKEGITIHSPKGKVSHFATSADIGFLKNGDRVTALRRPNGGIDALNTDGSTTELVPDHLANSAPTLAKTKDGNLRMLFSRALPEESDTPATGLDAGGSFSMDLKDGKWSQPRRQLLANAPVEEAAVITSFKLPYGHAHYKPMDTEVHLNGKQVGSMEKKIPAGRYIFPVDPKNLTFANRQSKEKNNITIKAKGIGPGNFHLSDKVGLYTRHKLCQDCLVADSAESAETLANQSSKSVRHSSPDLIIASNGYELPKSANPR